ncbi:hypothetical protein AK830_g3370 [Neonectria ditissima]|uniref:Uncharacterized protein n=1 Tax=Neonectria ditissima TaxID=78410 RepID=A0A0N8H801_9HYPO|nr:hypothetical protein AK830_g3370 [Neonectria ditissima]
MNHPVPRYAAATASSRHRETQLPRTPTRTFASAKSPRKSKSPVALRSPTSSSSPSHFRAQARARARAAAVSPASSASSVFTFSPTLSGSSPPPTGASGAPDSTPADISLLELASNPASATTTPPVPSSKDASSNPALAATPAPDPDPDQSKSPDPLLPPGSSAQIPSADAALIPISAPTPTSTLSTSLPAPVSASSLPSFTGPTYPLDLSLPLDPTAGSAPPPSLVSLQTPPPLPVPASTLTRKLVPDLGPPIAPGKSPAKSVTAPKESTKNCLSGNYSSLDIRLKDIDFAGIRTTTSDKTVQNRGQQWLWLLLVGSTIVAAIFAVILGLLFSRTSSHRFHNLILESRRPGFELLMAWLHKSHGIFMDHMAKLRS